MSVEQLVEILHDVFKPSFSLEEIEKCQLTIGGVQLELKTKEVWVLSFIKAHSVDTEK